MVKEKKYNKEWVRTFLFWLIGATGVGALLLFPDRLYFEAIVYSVMLVLSLVFIANFKQISKFSTHQPKRTTAKKFYGISNKWIRNIFIGLVFGGIFLAVSKIKLFGTISLSLAYPQLPLALTGQGFVVTILAPVVETLFFGIVLFSALNLFFGLWTSIIIRSTVFAGYHWWAYISVAGGAPFTVIIGTFISAFAFGVVGSQLAVHFGSEADASAHAFSNFWNWNEISKFFSIIG